VAIADKRGKASGVARQLSGNVACVPHRTPVWRDRSLLHDNRNS
jgi:hypothetical protein